MAFSFFSGAKKNDNLALVIDIGSSSVGSAFVLLNKEQKPHILAASRVDIVFQEEINIDRFRKAMVVALTESVRDLVEDHLPQISRSLGTAVPAYTYVIFSSPWYASQTRTVSTEQEKPFRMTKEVLDRIVRREVDIFERSAEALRMGNDPVIIEKHVMRVALNGYDTSEPFAKEATTLDVALFISVCPEQIMDEVIKAISTFFSRAHISFHSFLFAAFDVLRSLPSTQSRFLIVDIGGEVSDVGSVADQALLETISFPVGKRTILRNLSQALSTTPDEALSLIRLADEKRLSSAHTDRVGKALFDAGGVWVSGFEKILADVADRSAIPNTLFLFADDDVLPFLDVLAKREGLAQFTISDEPFSVLPLSTAALRDICTFEREAVRDSFLMVDAAFVHKIFSL